MELTDVSRWLLGLALATPRPLALFAIVPMFAKQTLGGTPRMGIVAALSLPLLPIIVPHIPDKESLGSLTMALLILKEMTVGLLMGLLVAIPFWAAEAIGFIVDNQRGAAMASQVNPMTQNESSPLGVAVYMALAVSFFSLGGMEAVLKVVYDSYLVWPIGDVLPQWSAAAPKLLLGALDRLMYLAVVLAGPMIVLMLVSELSLALVSMFAPQLQVFPLAMGVKSGVALFVMVVYVRLLMEFLTPEFDGFLGIVDAVKAIVQ